MAELHTVVVILFPLIAVVLSLQKVFNQGKSMNRAPVADYVWLTGYVCIQVAASLWLANALNSIQSEFRVTPEIGNAALRMGPVVFVFLAAALYLREIVRAVRHTVTPPVSRLLAVVKNLFGKR